MVMDSGGLARDSSGLEGSLQLRVVGDVSVPVEDRQVQLDLGKRGGGVGRPVGPAHPDVGDAGDVDDDRPLRVAAELEEKSVLRLAEVESLIRRLQVGGETAKPSLLGRRGPSSFRLFRPLVGGSEIAGASSLRTR